MTKKTNYKDYKTVEKFHQTCRRNGKRIPLSMMWGITKIQKAKSLNFQEAYEYLLKKGNIVEIE